MIQSKDIDAIMGADVVDSDDDRIGKVSQVYVDSQDQHPSWVAVKTGFFGSAETLVPIEDADWDSSRLHVGVSKATVKDAPHVDPDREITVDEQNRLYRHYGIGAQVEGGTAPSAGREETTVTDASTDTERSADTGRHVASPDDAAPDRASTDAATGDQGSSDGLGYAAGAPLRIGQDASPEQDSADARSTTGAQDAVDVRDTTPTDTTPTDTTRADDTTAVDTTATDSSRIDAAATDAAPAGSYHGADQVAQEGSTVAPAESETERDTSVAGARPAPSGTATAVAGTPVAGVGYRMRLRKVTVTEQRTVTVTVPVTHEEVRLERVPDDEPDGPDVIQGEADVVLMAERPVVTTEQVAVEHVHVAVDPVTDETRS